MTTVPYRSTTRLATRPTVEDLDHYLADHTVPQAAKRWHVNERTIRKWRTRIDAPRAAEQPQEVRKPITAIDAPSFVPTSDDRAGDGTMWLDPWMGELMPVPPGAHRKDWERERIAARDRHKAAVTAALTPALDAAFPGPLVDTMSSQDEPMSAAPAIEGSPSSAPASNGGPDLEAPYEALQSPEMSGMGRTMDDDELITRPPAPVIVRERVVNHHSYQRVYRIIDAPAPRNAYSLATDGEVMMVIVRAALIVALLVVVMTLAS